ncbi:MAG TPA: AI-2E family transporter [Gemmatimonadota bacterium]|nr:AI-2E family transporter [Gemmatimonadota bacterium]
MTEASHGGREHEPSRPDLSHLLDLFSGPLDVRSIALTGILILLVFYTLYFARGFVLPVVLAFLLTFLLAPVVRALRRVGIPETIGAGLVILASLSGVGYGVYSLSGPARDWIERAPEGMRRVERRVRDLQRPVTEVREAAEQVQQQVEEMAGQGRRQRPTEVQLEGETLTGLVFTTTQAFLAGAVVTVILLYFLLASGDLFLRKLVRVLPRLRDKKAAIEIARDMEDQVSTYLVTMTLINIGLGVAVGTAMRLAGMPNPVLWGAAAAVMNFVPYLGPVVTLGMIALVSLLTFEELGRALVAPVLYLGLNALEGYVATPMLLGRRLLLNPVVIFLGIIFWGWLWGIPGALLAVPILVSLKIFCDHIEPLSPIGEFLGR